MACSQTPSLFIDLLGDSKTSGAGPSKREKSVWMETAPADGAGASPLRSYPDFVICKTGIVCFARASVIPSPPFYIA